MKAGAAGKEKRFCDFYDKVRASEATCAKKCLERIRASSEWGSLAGDMWLLERRSPADYGRKDHINMKAQTDALNYNVDLTENEIEAKRSALLTRILGELEAEPTETDY